jgi:hypothetical protein
MSTAKRGLQLYPQNEALQKLVSELQTPKVQEPKSGK